MTDADLIIVGSAVLCASWSWLARELNTGRKNLSRLEAYSCFAVLIWLSGVAWW